MTVEHSLHATVVLCFLLQRIEVLHEEIAYVVRRLELSDAPHAG
jgi:hypothetical protein